MVRNSFAFPNGDFRGARIAPRIIRSGPDEFFFSDENEWETALRGLAPILLFNIILGGYSILTMLCAAIKYYQYTKEHVRRLVCFAAKIQNSQAGS